MVISLYICILTCMYYIILLQASSYILGDEARAKTRAQTRKLSESEEKKPAVKRTSTMAQTAKVCGTVDAL